jgi:6-phosphogluconolactonase
MPTNQPPDVRVFENLDELSREATQGFIDLVSDNAAHGRISTVALSGGSTPRRLYEMLADSGLGIEWSHVHLFQVDERCVSPDDAESNFRMMREALLSRIAIPQPNFHRMVAELPDRDEVARLYGEEIAKTLTAKTGAWPRFDLIFLGMGADGHTASLFPDSAALEERNVAVCANYSPRLGTHRITLTFPVLNAAAEVIFLVAGEDKSETLRKILEGPDGRFPAQGVKPANGALSWFADKAAAGKLGRTARNAT